MKSFWAVLVMSLLLVACFSEPTARPTETLAPTQTSVATKALINKTVAVATPILPPTLRVAPSSTPIETAEPLFTSTFVPLPTQTIPPATLEAEATITAFGDTCEAPAREQGIEISPNGNWLAMVCWDKANNINPYLRVANLHDNRDWVIEAAEYITVEYFYFDPIYPFHWSHNGKYLYMASSSRMSGCCWIGYDMLLVRLNLENGQQTEVVNFYRSGQTQVGVDFSFSSSDRFFLYALRGTLYILDLLTWDTRAIKLAIKNRGSAGHILMSNDDKKIILVFREYSQDIQGDLTFGSLVLIDLNNDSQQKLLSGLEYLDMPKPVDWIDDNHVLLSTLYTNDGYWVLDINTAEITKTESP